jgi:cobalamin biosynthesis Mg chelatase CobN
MKKTSTTQFFALTALIWSSFTLAPHAISQTATGEQRTHGVNAPATSIGPSPDAGSSGAENRDDNDINAKSTSAGANPGSNSGQTASGTATDNAPRSELSGTAQTDNQETGGIWPFAIPIAAVVVGVPLALMFMMRRSKSRREN